MKIKETPILKRIERRQTSLHNGSPVRSFEKWHEMSVREKSRMTSSETDIITRCLSEKSGFTDEGSSMEYSSASTLVVTDTDLASSWIYTNKKAIASSPTMNTKQVSAPPPPPPPPPPPQGLVTSAPVSNDSEKELEDGDESMESPMEQFIPIPIARRPRSRSTSCCYFSVMLIVFVCVFGILSSIGGVVYLEVFARNRTSAHAVKAKDAKSQSIIESPQDIPIGNSNIISSSDPVAVHHIELHRSGHSDVVLATTPENILTGVKRRGRILEPDDQHPKLNPAILVDSLEDTQKNMDHARVNSVDEVTEIPADIYKPERPGSPTVVRGSHISNSHDDTPHSTVEKQIHATTGKEPPLAVSSVIFVKKDQRPSSSSEYSNENAVSSAVITHIKITATENDSLPNLLATDASKQRRKIDLRTSISEVLKRFQTLENVHLPSSRIGGQTRNYQTVSYPVTPLMQDDIEKKLYLDRLRILIYDSSR